MRLIRKFWRAIQRLRIRPGASLEASDDYPPKIARTPYDSDVARPIMIASSPARPIAEMNIARTPGIVEVLPPAVQVLPVHPPPTQVSEDKTSRRKIITSEVAENGKDFF